MASFCYSTLLFSNCDDLYDRHLHNDIFGKQKSMSDYGRQQIQACCQIAEKRPVRSSICVIVDKTWSLLSFLDIMGDEPEVLIFAISLRDRSALSIVQHYSDISAFSKKDPFCRRRLHVICDVLTLPRCFLVLHGFSCLDCDVPLVFVLYKH